MEAFLQCAACKKILFSLEYEQALEVCPHCGHHHRISAQKRIDITFDPESFDEHDADIASENPLGFPDYKEKLKSSEKKTGLMDSVLTGMAKLDGVPVSVAVAEFGFMGGSMGSASGEKIVRTFERAIDKRIPTIIFCASGGARMQEGLLSLMQMPKTVAAVASVWEARLPYIAIYTDPTMAGVLASYASIADVILSEPKALIGFAGARVSKQAQVGRAPEDFQTAEFCFRNGMIDKIVPRREMRQTLSSLVKSLSGCCSGC